MRILRAAPAGAAVAFITLAAPATALATTNNSEAATSSTLSPSTTGSATNTASPLFKARDADKGINICKTFANNHHLGAYLETSVTNATGKKYRGGASVVLTYSKGSCHVIVRNGQVLHGPHYRPPGDLCHLTIFV